VIFPLPQFLVSVASKGVSVFVRPLESTLVRDHGSVANKGLTQVVEAGTRLLAGKLLRSV
jgi:hypothetical protein